MLMLDDQNQPAPTLTEPTANQTDSKTETTGTAKKTPDSQATFENAGPTGLKGWWIDHWKVALPAIAIAVLASVGGWYYYSNRHKPAPAAQSTPKPPPAPTAPQPVQPVSPLTGAPVSADLASRPITGVVIENHTDARPQSGLQDAGVVYEALAEGGITRFEAFFLEHEPTKIGPVRSLRTYFLSWGLEFNAPIAHAGGNADALDLVGPRAMKDMNEFSWGSYFYRSSDRYAPHNLYTSTASLDALEKRLGYFHSVDFTPSPRKPDAPSASPNASILDLNYSYNGYQVEYRYDGSCDCYNRYLAGAPHIDRNTGKIIQVKNVVVEEMPTAYGTTRIGEQTVRMGQNEGGAVLPVGTNKAYVFRDGTVVTGTWHKDNDRARTKLLDDSGNEIPLDVGNTWYSILPSDRTPSYH